MKCKLTPDSGAIAVQTPYDSGFVAELKSTIPYTDRRYKPDVRQWIVSPLYGGKIRDLCYKYFNETPDLPSNLTLKPTTKQMILDVRYIGITKERGSDDRSAYGWYKDGWNVMFPESILRAWFDAPANPDEQPTLYSVLGVRRDATTDEIKSGYRRMVMQWHPDRCHEPNAEDQFLAVQHAYDILTKSRDRYDAGLAFEASLKQAPKADGSLYSVATGYRSPLRCGFIMCEGVEVMGIFQVSKIFGWEDIRDVHGRVLVVSWKRGEDHFTEVWA